LNTVAEGRRFPTWKEVYQMVTTFIIFSFTLIFFRSESVAEAFLYIKRIFASDYSSIELLYSVEWYVILIMILFEWCGRMKKYPLEKLPASKYLRFAIYVLLGILIMIHITPEQQEFIYFQF
jgi:hypothetical protein